MAASDEWTEWHLTPGGWVSGSKRVDGTQGTTTKPPPADRVQTVKYWEYMGSHASPMSQTHDVLWESSDAAEVAALRQKYGEPPRSL